MDNISQNNKKRKKLFILIGILILFLVVLGAKGWLGYIKEKKSEIGARKEIKTAAEQIEQKMIELKEEAIRTNNPDLCKKILEIKEKEIDPNWEIEKYFIGRYYVHYDPCIIETAVKTKNESICYGLRQSFVLGERIKECQKKVFLTTTDLCKEVSDTKAKEDCIIKIARETNNLELCRKMLQVDCVNKIAIEMNNPDACYKYDYGRFHSDCITQIALNKNNALICKKLFVEDQGGCIIKVAVKTRNPEFCKLIIDERTKEGCYLEVGK